MKSLVASVLFFLSSLPALALTLEPLTWTTAQFTAVGAAVPEPIGVLVRDDAGQPVEGVAVTFSVVLIPGETGSGFFPPDLTTVTVLTDEFGIAIPEPTIVGSIAGSFNVVASSTAVSNQATFLITVEGLELAVAELRVVSDDPAGFAVQALDDFGQPVPFATVEFAAPLTGPSGTFQGSTSILVTANEQGIAIAPTFVSNGVDGNGLVTVTVVGTDVSTQIRFQNKSNGGGGGTCKHDSKGGHKHDGKHPGKDC
jgi:hypothetical protein